MRKLFGRGWTIAARLLTLALVPAALMMLAVNASLYANAESDADADIQERGRILAAALAESSRYGVISGNARTLQETVGTLLRADASIVSIEVQGADRRRLTFGASNLADADVRTFEAPISSGALDVNLFDVQPDARGAEGRAVPTPPIGFVRVVMSSEPILEAKRLRLYLGSATVLVAALASALVGLLLAKRLREPLATVMRALRGIRQGRFDVQLDSRAGGELGELQTAIVDMAKELKTSHEELEEQVATRTRQLAQAVERARAADAEKGRLIARGNELVEEERSKISRDIHDDFNARLVSIRLQVDALAHQAASAGQEQIRASAERIADIVDQAYESARDIVTRLRPEIIDTLGLSGAIEEVVRRLDEVSNGCRFEALVAEPLPAMPDRVAIAAYRVTQEALSNVVKHSGATLCLVKVAADEKGEAITLRIRDDGTGFDSGHETGGLGIAGMRERAHSLGGTLSIQSAPGQGTEVTVVLPVKVN